MTIDNAAYAARTLEERVACLVNERLDIVVDRHVHRPVRDGDPRFLAFVTLLQAVEEEFGITIGVDELDIDSFRSIDSVVRFVRRMRVVAPSPALRGLDGLEQKGRAIFTAKVVIYGTGDVALLANYFLTQDSPHETVAFCSNESE